MTTTEIINSKEVKITWEFSYVADDLAYKWCLWFMEGIGSDGKKYYGSCEAHRNKPSVMHDSVVNDIEEQVKQVQ